MAQDKNQVILASSKKILELERRVSFVTVNLKYWVQAISDDGLSITPPVEFSFFCFCVQNACARSTRTLSTRARRARAGFLKISKLHASTRAKRARAEKPACCDCTRVAEHFFEQLFDTFPEKSI